jgi:hypothetical protein
VFRGHLEPAADVVGGQFLHVLRRELGQVHPDAAGHEHLPDAFLLADLFEQVDRRRVVGPE